MPKTSARRWLSSAAVAIVAAPGLTVAAGSAGEEVASARIRAYSEAGVGLDEYVDIYRTTGGWTESGVTWNAAPARGTGLGESGGFAPGEGMEWDVTPALGDGGSVNFEVETTAQR